MDPILPPHIDPTPTKYDPPAPAQSAVAPTPAAKIDPHRIKVWLALAASVASIVIAVLNGGKTPIIPPPAIQQSDPVVQSAKADAVANAEYIPSFGWVNDQKAVQRSFARMAPVIFGDTPAGKAVMEGPDVPDVYLWQSVRKAANKVAPWYPNIDQRDVGCCVGCGWKHAADVCQAVQIVNRKSGEFRPLSAEVIYGGSRVEVGGGQIQGDGSVGAWAREWVKSRGVAEMRKYNAADLSVFSPARAKRFGATGVPEEIETEASSHPVKATAMVKTWQDVNRAIRQGYPVAVCSNQGFTMTRDQAGFARPQGQWGHCMAIIGVRAGTRPGGFILNSWGDKAHTGPVFPADAPVAGFWADSAVIERMVGMGDSFALADLEGFDARTLDWFARAAPKRQHNDLFAHIVR